MTHQRKQAGQVPERRSFLNGFPLRSPTTGKACELTSQSDLSRLQKYRLPIMHQFSDLAKFLEITEQRLMWLTLDKGKHYKRFELKKKSGKIRVIHAPRPAIKSAQHAILRQILDKVPLTEQAMGFAKGRSIKQHAQLHQGRAIVVSLDLENFFPTIRSKRVFGLFRQLGYSEEVALALSLICTRKGSLPQGAPTSPAIANLICRKLDTRLNGLAKKFVANYSRYADDLTFSGDLPFKAALHHFLPMLRKIVSNERFRLNKDKIRFARASASQIVTGLVVNQNVNLPRKERKRLRAVLHQAEAHGLPTVRNVATSHVKEALQGKLAFAQFINPQSAKSLYNQFRRLR